MKPRQKARLDTLRAALSRFSHQLDAIAASDNSSEAHFNETVLRGLQNLQATCVPFLCDAFHEDSNETTKNL